MELQIQHPIRVLVVDDSLFMRTLVSDMLESDPTIEVVAKAKTGCEALELIQRERPDCVTLDLVMPGWDGLTTLKHIMEQCPVSVIILSAYSQHDAEITLACLEAGAIGYVMKPSGELSLNIDKVKNELLLEVAAAAKIDVAKVQLLTERRPQMFPLKKSRENGIVVMGASTGGMQTLEVILPTIPETFSVPIIVAQHMPNSFFTKSLCQHLNNQCLCNVMVAEHHMILEPGCIYLAPGGAHTLLEPRPNGQVILRIEEPPCPECLTPSINRLMNSAAQEFGETVLGVILTGMGDDGCEGMQAIKAAGGQTLVQDESSMIFGMPKAVIDAGCADRICSVDEIANAMMIDVCQEVYHG